MLKHIRERFHPLFHLRQIPAFRSLAMCVDFTVKARVDGVSFPVYVNWLQHLALVIGDCGVEREERDHFKEICALNDIRTLWDICANVGLYSFLFKTLAPTGRVVAFEPAYDNIKLLNGTIPTTRWKTSRSSLRRSAAHAGAPCSLSTR